MALAIVGLICIGVVGLGTVLSLRPGSSPVEQAAVASPVPLQPTFTPSPTITPIPPTPTDTPLPTSTPTLVVNPNAQEVADDARPTEVPLPSIFDRDSEETPVPGVEGAPGETAVPGEAPAVEVSPTNTLVIQSPTAVALAPVGTAPAAATPAQIPQGGGVLPEGNGFLVWAGVGTLLLLIFGLINYLRSPQV